MRIAAFLGKVKDFRVYLVQMRQWLEMSHGAGNKNYKH